MYKSTIIVINDAATAYIYTLSLHDALPISLTPNERYHKFNAVAGFAVFVVYTLLLFTRKPRSRRSEEHTSELQSRREFVCRLLLEKKKSIGVREEIGGVAERIYSNRSRCSS